MRRFGVVALCVMLGGCGLAARQEREQQQAAAAAAMQQGFENCKVQFPEGTKNMIEKNKCNATAALAIRPFTTYTDLFDRYWATRAVIAERVQAGKMTVAEANQEATQAQSDIAAEEQRRNLANRSVGAQESAAAAAWMASPSVVVVRR
ncbi:hypothetical protein [Bradyrhizobium sp. WSM1253]|uniref:hypothetical protein n=1 Tax=Bradyrhizobium sp. WSM1253 TaxID=319003 RepID=UPI000A05998A|nr:hypothetical protein [Bradyrhizobium sp. WSM1253]